MTNDEELCKSLIEQNEDMDTGCADSAENSSVHSNLSDGENVFSAALQRHWLVKTVLLFMKYHTMAIVCSVLYHISYRPLVYVLLTAMD